MFVIVELRSCAEVSLHNKGQDMFIVLAQKFAKRSITIWYGSAEVNMEVVDWRAEVDMKLDAALEAFCVAQGRGLRPLLWELWILKQKYDAEQGTPDGIESSSLFGSSVGTQCLLGLD